VDHRLRMEGPRPLPLFLPLLSSLHACFRRWVGLTATSAASRCLRTSIQAITS
jgi:hypothetical protein